MIMPWKKELIMSVTARSGGFTGATFCAYLLNQQTLLIPVSYEVVSLVIGSGTRRCLIQGSSAQ